MLAWEIVNANNEPSERPSKIFLVVVQTLPPGYAIAHKRVQFDRMRGFAFVQGAMPHIIDIKSLVQYNAERARAALGFEEIQKEAHGQKIFTMFAILLRFGDLDGFLVA